MQRIAIVAITYNRPDSLKRLLESLKSAAYENELVDLVISIDKSSMEQSIVKVLNEFEWLHGEKIIRTFDERQGLRSHVLKCGDLTDIYDAVIIFEDDIVAAKGFYKFTREALAFYHNDNRIGGIALYSPAINEMALMPFTPVRRDSDVFFLQSAQSWGQCWSREMWKAFRTWYANNSEPLKKSTDMPERIYSWPETSWKKYFMKYIVEEKKYFVYPYDSLSTNSSDVGQHVAANSTDFQVPLFDGIKKYKFTSLENSARYDIFFEREDINDALIPIEVVRDLCVDLYGTKKTNQGRRYLLTRRILNFKEIKTFGLCYKPHENNIFIPSNGSEIHLYDTEQITELKIDGSIDFVSYLNYSISTPWKFTIIHGISGAFNYLFKIFKFSK